MGQRKDEFAGRLATVAEEDNLANCTKALRRLEGTAFRRQHGQLKLVRRPIPSGTWLETPALSSRAKCHTAPVGLLKQKWWVHLQPRTPHGYVEAPLSAQGTAGAL